jgi:LPS-assembly lipoprotein
MWWSDRRGLVLALAALPLAAGCGFRPALGRGGSAAALQGRIRADDPRDRAAFELVARLEERLGPPGPDALRLAYALSLREEVLGRTAGVGDTRGQVSGTLRYELSRPGEAGVLHRGSVAAFAGYSRTATPLANRAAQEDARRRVTRMLADDLVTDLVASAAGWAGP